MGRVVRFSNIRINARAAVFVKVGSKGALANMDFLVEFGI
jgi:hypothetical protein